MPPNPLTLLLLPLIPPLIVLYLLVRRVLTRTRLAHLRALHPKPRATPPEPLHTPATLLIVLGSGGHTAEMLTLLRDTLSTPLFRSAPPQLVYAVADTDAHSATRAAALHAASPVRLPEPMVVKVPRAREVGQGVVGSVVGTARLVVSAWRLLGRVKPDAILSNGPANGAVFAWIGVLREALIGERLRIVYVESVARVSGLSVSGRLVYPIADRFLVQWEEVTARWPEAEYLGRVC